MNKNLIGKITLLLIGLSFFAVAPTLAQAPAPAGEAQGGGASGGTIWLGGGTGSYIFSNKDEFRETNANEIATLTQNYYLELQEFNDPMGIGLRLLYLTEDRKYQGLTQYTSVQMNLFTMGIRPFPDGGITSNLGFIIGLGQAEYNVITELLQDSNGNFLSQRSFFSTGDAALWGVYVDIGGDGIGARIGYQYIFTSLANVSSEGELLHPNVSGKLLHFDLRVLF